MKIINPLVEDLGPLNGLGDGFGGRRGEKRVDYSEPNRHERDRSDDNACNCSITEMDAIVVVAFRASRANTGVHIGIYELEVRIIIAKIDVIVGFHGTIIHIVKTRIG